MKLPLLVVLALWTSTVTLAGAAEPELRVGQPVELGLDPGPGGGIVADDLTVLDDRRSPKLRGEVRGVSPATGEVKILVWTIRVDDRTEFDRGALEDLAVGQVVQVKATVDDGVWWAKKIETQGVKRSWKLKGTLTAVVGDSDDPTAVEVDGLYVPFVQGTDLWTQSDTLLDELFDDLREDDDLGVFGSRLHRVGPFELSGSFRQNLRRQRAIELEAGEERDLVEPSLRFEASTRAAGWNLFAQARLNSRVPLREDGLAPVEEEHEVRIYQLHASRRELFGLPLGMVVGKLRARDEREFLFDEYLDGARVYFHGLRPVVLEATVFEPVLPLSEKFEDWSDLLLQLRWNLGEKSRARVYSLWREDASSRNRDVRYTGMAFHGRRGPAKTWLDATWLGGEDKGLEQDAFAVDLGIGLRAKSWRGRPSVWFGHARGSGDEDPDDAVSNEFRQTGYEDNSSRVWGIASRPSYGEALDPELRNLRVSSAGFAFRPFTDVSVEIIGHLYRLDRLDDEFDGGDLELTDEPLTGLHTDIGRELDVVVAMRNLLPSLHAALRVGRFDPGEAFGPGADAAWSQRLEVRWDF